MNRSLALTPPQLAEVRRVLAAHLPPGMGAAAFGSRAGGVPKPWSDLDLALDGPVDIPLLGALVEAFDDSELPFKVDLVDRSSVNGNLGAVIAAAGVPVWP